MNSKVYVKFPRAGLGNRLLTWGRGYVFSRLNNLEMHTSSWTDIHFGALIRRERKKRFYIGYFKEKGFVQKLIILCFKLYSKKVYEPAVSKMERMPNDTIFIFNKIFTDYDFFKELRPYRKMVKKGLFQILKPSLKRQFDNYEKPVIALHIRRGDFKIGSTITPLSFFIEVVNGVRKELGEDLPVTVFTDAYPKEIKPLLELEKIKIAEEKPDILDILLLASSQIIVLSVGSTFSYWGAFLSEGIIIKHSKEGHAPFRSATDPLFDKEIAWNGSFKTIL